MKIDVGQTKRGIVLIFTEKDDTSRTVHLLWREAIGLRNALQNAVANPAFEQRDPRSKKPEVRNLETIEDTSD